MNNKNKSQTGIRYTVHKINYYMIKKIQEICSNINNFSTSLNVQFMTSK